MKIGKLKYSRKLTLVKKKEQSKKSLNSYKNWKNAIKLQVRNPARRDRSPAYREVLVMTQSMQVFVCAVSAADLFRLYSVYESVYSKVCLRSFMVHAKIHQIWPGTSKVLLLMEYCINELKTANYVAQKCSVFLDWTDL